MDISLPIVCGTWNVCTPTLFRYMDKKFVDDFFKDGSIRISSFDMFHKHVDEQRLDKGEGRLMFVHNTKEGNEGKGQAITSWILYDKKAFVFSTCVKYDKSLQNQFNASSYLRIKDSTRFGIAIAKKIPGLTVAFEGFCLYQEKKIFLEDFGFINIEQFYDEQKNLDIEKLRQFIVGNARHYPLFMKDKSFENQVEYRFVWLTNVTPTDYIDIKVPEAINYCAPPNELTE